jgi:hypothetical protein
MEVIRTYSDGAQKVRLDDGLEVTAYKWSDGWRVFWSNDWSALLDHPQFDRHYGGPSSYGDTWFTLREQPSQACRDCGESFPYDPDTDRCAKCCAAALGEV